jgi:hypothetical protein
MPAAYEATHLRADMTLDENVAVIVQHNPRSEVELEFHQQRLELVPH